MRSKQAHWHLNLQGKSSHLNLHSKSFNPNPPIIMRPSKKEEGNWWWNRRYKNLSKRKPLEKNSWWKLETHKLILSTRTSCFLWRSTKRKKRRLRVIRVNFNECCLSTILSRVWTHYRERWRQSIRRVIVQLKFSCFSTNFRLKSIQWSKRGLHLKYGYASESKNG